jgi:predicted O-linked N-acetylglucosamine transferase (SPINDLY family)
MTALELATETVSAPDTDHWLVNFLIAHADAGIPEHAADVLRARLRGLSFTAIVDALDRAGEAAGHVVAIQLYQHWIASQPAGTAHLFAAWFNLGVALSRAGLQANAVTAYQNAIALRPDFHSAAVNLGVVLESAGQPELALQAWDRALQPDDARTTLINHRARLLEQLGRLAEAEAEMQRSLLIQPQQPDVIQHWVHIRQKMCAWPVLAEAIPGLKLDDLLRHAGPLGVLALSDDIRIQRDAASDWIQRKTFRPPLTLSPVHGYRHERIRLGYLSSDFCRHAMSYLIAEVFEQHDRDRFEVFGYCSSPDDGSAIRARVIRAFDHFRTIKHLPDEHAARVIRDDEIDVLIDLNGLTSGSRLQILRWKPAPVQATYLGFIGPVPLPELDYMFCDDIVVPPELASGYEPAPLYIAGNYQANDSKRTIGAATTRAAAGLPDDRLVFCCFSNHYKITEDMFAAWMTILQRCDNAVIWLVGDNEWACRNMLTRAAGFGIGPDRIVFASRVGPDEYMARLRLADVFLDTFPYNAGTIASDAIRMGLPLVTVAGRSFASRMAGRLLAAVGADQGVAANLREYIDFAVSLATDSQALAAYRALFAGERWQQEIGNIARFMTAYEASLLAVAKRAPA